MQDLQGYKAIVHSMFDDGRVNHGRLLLLKAFTDDVCDSLDGDDGIREYYDKCVLPKLTARLKTPPPRPSVVPVVFAGCVCVGLLWAFGRYG